MQVMSFEWNTAKAIENRRRHGIDFADAIAAVEDPNRLEEIDDRFEYGEERTQIIGTANQQHFVRHHDCSRRRYVPHHLCREGHAI